MINKRYNKSVSKLVCRNKRLRKFKITAVLFVPVIFLSLILYLSRLPSLQVSFIDVSGEKTVAKDDIKNATLEYISGKRFFFFPNTNIFLVNEAGVAAVLISEFPRIEEVDVNKNADGVLKVEIKERSPVALWCNNSCFLLDSSGLIYSKVENDVELFGKLVFRGSIEGDPLMSHFQNKEEIDSYLKVVLLLKSKNINTKSINIQSTDKAIIETDIGNIFVDPNSKDLSSAIDNAILVIEDRVLKEPGSKFEYIDTRFGNKVFYK